MQKYEKKNINGPSFDLQALTCKKDDTTRMMLQ